MEEEVWVQCKEAAPTDRWGCGGDVVCLAIWALVAVLRTGMSPLIYAAERGHNETVEALLRAGASVDIQDNRGKRQAYGLETVRE